MSLANKLGKISGKRTEKPNFIKCEIKIKRLIVKSFINAIRGKRHTNFNEFYRDIDNHYIKKKLENKGFRVKIIKDFRIYSGIFW